MNRQFVRIYLGIAVVLLLSIVGVLAMSRQWLNRVRRADYDDQTARLVNAIRDELAAGDMQEQYLVLNMFSLTHHLPIKLEPMVLLPLSSQEKRRLQAGNIITLDIDGKLQTYAEAPDGDVIVLGPYAVGQMVQWQNKLANSEGRRGGFSLFGSGPLFAETDYFFLGILIVSFAAIGAAIFFLIRPLERRIYALSEVAERFGKGDLDCRANAQQEDAISDLAHSFNGMADRIGSLVQGQRDMLRAVSHELRTPLARAFFLINNLKKAGAQEKRDHCVFRIERSLAELNDLVDELLIYARMEAGTGRPEVEAVDVCTEVEALPEAVAELREGLVVETACDPLIVMAEGRYFKRALMNLVTNAARHARSRIWISCRKLGTVAEISVEDDGPGIPEALREKIFDLFYRVDESRNTNIGGTGLGLAIVRRIMHMHGGRVWVGDGSAGGARFVLSFPGASSVPESERPHHALSD